MRKTKIVATIGPACLKPGIIENLGEIIDVARFNLKHNTTDWHQSAIAKILAASKAAGREVKIMVDIPNSDMPIEVENFDLIAASYINKATEIGKLKMRAQAKGWPTTIIAKIETKNAVNNLEEICQAADGIMVARGDLGRALVPQLVNIWQKKIIETARSMAKPVIVATEMLMSMVTNPEPTRAEVSDVANAIFDGTDALLLSNETAVGKYPVEASKTLETIAWANEGSQYERKLWPTKDTMAVRFLRAGAEVLGSGKLAGAIVFSKSGESARILAGFRPPVEIIGISNSTNATAVMSITSGVRPILIKIEETDKYRITGPVFKELLNIGAIDTQGEYLVIHGNNWMESGTIGNMSLVRFNK